jgi:hypothetical protein
MLRHPNVGTCNRTNSPDRQPYPTSKHGREIRAWTAKFVRPWPGAPARWLVTKEAWVSDRPDDVDAAFAEIVADLEREGVGRTIPDMDDLSDDPPEDSPSPESSTGIVGSPPGSPGWSLPPTDRVEPPPKAWRGHDGDWDWSWGTDEDHYVPPEPPPLPRLRPLTIVALLLVVVGVLLLIIPTLVGLDARIATPIALLSVLSGGGMLLLRVRQSPKDSGGRDDGAQI